MKAELPKTGVTEKLIITCTKEIIVRIYDHVLTSVLLLNFFKLCFLARRFYFGLLYIKILHHF